MAPLINLHTTLLFSPTLKTFLPSISLTIDPSTGLITSIHHRTEPLPTTIPVPDVDLRGLTVLPGLVDAHTHIFLHPYSETPPLNQMRDESLVERVIRATIHCRAALLAGYTTYRDLGTEGLRDADVGFRDAVNRGIIPGPRLFVATEAIASSGGYEIRGENGLGGTVAPRIADVADGIEGVRAAVRRRIGAGADVVKVYADYRKRQMRCPPCSWQGAPDVLFPLENSNPNVVLFTQGEMDEMVREARNSNTPIAAHAGSSDAVVMAAKAGATTVEHGYDGSNEALIAMKDAGTIFVPTLAVCELYFQDKMVDILANTKKAFDMGIKVACGGDTGAFAHGDNAREMELMIEAGVPLEDVLVAATLHGWEACGGDMCGRRFGWWEEGVAADIVALDGDPREDMSALRKVSFVMKDGKVWKKDSVAVGMA